MVRMGKGDQGNQENQEKWVSLERKIVGERRVRVLHPIHSQNNPLRQETLPTSQPQINPPHNLHTKVKINFYEVIFSASCLGLAVMFGIN